MSRVAMRYTHIMWRWAFRVLLCLILGAITTVAVAWGIAYTSGERERSWVIDPWRDWVDPRDGRGISTLASREWGWTFVRFTFQGDVPSGRHVATFSHIPPWAMRWSQWTEVLPPEANGRGEIEIHAYGFPSPTLALTVTTDANWSVSGSYLIPVEDPPRLKELGRIPNNLPLFPIWPGLAINTLFYSAIWFALFVGFVSAKRLIRITRGRCRHCGYDLRGNSTSGCPECGWNRPESERSVDSQ